MKTNMEVPMKIKASIHIELQDCGMGMPVIRAWQAIKKVEVGEIVHLSSSHP